VINGMNCEGVAGANDSGFDLELLHHKATGWTYSAAAFVPGDGAIVQMTTDYVTEINLATSNPFAYKRTGLSTSVTGSGDEGYLIRMTTGTSNAVRYMNCTVDVTSN
jgi:hypothetical protein